MYNNITDVGVKQLSNVIVNSQLNSLGLGARNLTDEGVKQLGNVNFLYVSNKHNSNQYFISSHQRKKTTVNHACDTCYHVRFVIQQRPTDNKNKNSLGLCFERT